MLREENKNITEVYLAVGFESQCSFNRNFREIMGVTPVKYRQGYRMGENAHKGMK
jgi:AraC-like DNA-binding protein